MNRQRILVAVHDFLASWLAFCAILIVRVGFDEIPTYAEQMIVWGAAFSVICAIVYQLIGLTSVYWRYTSMMDIRLIVAASATSVILWVTVNFSITRMDHVPRSFPFLLFLAEVVALTTPRLVYRLVRDQRDRRRSRGQRPRLARLLLVGGPNEVFQAINWAAAYPNRVQVVGILSPKQRHVGLSILQTRVLGSIRDLSAVLDKLEVDDRFPDSVLLCAGAQRLDSDELDILTTVCGMRGARLLRDFQPDKIFSESGALRAITPLSGLLGRPEANALPEETQKKLVAGKRILITGAGGTIGAEVARKVAAAGPARLGVLDLSEFNLYQIGRELREDYPDLVVDQMLGNIRDRDVIRKFVRNFEPDIVIHAAALKHVDIVEQAPREGAMTNIFGTINVAEAAAEAGARIFVQVSTDKAVNPASVMGLTKRICELYVSWLDRRAEQAQSEGTRFASVRFGNVIGSSGSVLPLFRQQIERGGPVTVTHPDMERYFMTVREAAGLILQAAYDALVNESRRGRVFVLEMGKPVKILDLAKQMVASAGLSDDQDIKIVFTGLRPGERLSEALFSADEESFHTAQHGVMFAEPRVAAKEFSVAALRRLREATDADNAAEIHACLRILSGGGESSVGPDKQTEAAKAASGKILPLRPAHPRVSADSSSARTGGGE